MPPAPRFRKGDVVVHRSTREMGRIERDAVLDGGEYWYRVRFVQRVENIVETDLDPLEESDESLEQLATRGRWGRVQAFRCALAVERITQANRSTLYSFRAQRILFEPYQYKPLLKILDSPDRRLLIADEVGLGKTIEAALILTELEARRPLDRVLVVCPSRLRHKWREELNRKFDQEFDIYDKQGLTEYLDRVRQNPTRGRLRGIISMETLRNEELRELLAAEVGHLDLVIVDEAHHARNPGTLTSEMLGDLCDIGDSILLLTATPLHLSNRDLFTLLKALRPTDFRDEFVFDRDLQRHAPIHRAGALVRSGKEEALKQATALLEQVFVQGIPENLRDPLALYVIKEMRSGPPQDRRGWIELERKIQDLHPLASILTRTRKRDVQECAPVRRARVFRCQWTDEEDRAYQELVEGSGSQGWIHRALAFAQIQKARQAASCLPAAWEAQGLVGGCSDDDAVELTDILPSEVPKAIGSPPPSPGAAPRARWSGKDSKFEKLLEILRMVWQEEPGAKVLIFTFFVGTAKYLERRLVEQGYPALRIAGDVRSDPQRPDRDERGERMREFREDPEKKVLVSTEVGSEGLDFHFCHHVVNYDLPWNPMVVEQRIGRIDRFGQQSDVVHIHTLIVKGTVEDRILHRLYERIGIFRQSIGDLEPILGETIGELQRDYVSGRLSPEEADQRVDQAARAIEQRRAHLEQLQQNAAKLFGHEEYIREEMKRTGRLGRFVSEEAMLAVIKSFLQAHHPDAGLWEEREGIYGLRLTDNLRDAIRDASVGSHLWVARGRSGQLLITTRGEIAFREPAVELINVSHPLVKAAVKAVQKQLEGPLARVAHAVVEIRDEEDAELDTGVYFLVVFTHTVEGIRARRILEIVAWSEASQRIIDADLAERLLHLLDEQGAEWDRPQPGQAMSKEVWEHILSEARKRNRELLEREQRENEALYTRRKRVLQAEYEHARDVKETRLRTAEKRGHKRVLPALRGQLEKAEAEYRAKLATLEERRTVAARLSEPVAICLVEVRGR